MAILLSPNWYLVAAAWYLLSGILHDVFVVRQHKGPYNRDLLRLLMDGHVLILTGLLIFVCWHMVKNNLIHGPVIAFILAGGMIVYCFMIFPFLKSFVTLGISAVLAASSLALIIKLYPQT